MHVYSASVLQYDQQSTNNWLTCLEVPASFLDVHEYSSHLRTRSLGIADGWHYTCTADIVSGNEGQTAASWTPGGCQPGSSWLCRHHKRLGSEAVALNWLAVHQRRQKQGRLRLYQSLNPRLYCGVKFDDLSVESTGKKEEIFSPRRIFGSPPLFYTCLYGPVRRNLGYTTLALLEQEWFVCRYSSS